MSGQLIHEPAEVYHQRAADNLSSHQLAKFRISPLLYHRAKRGLLEDDGNRPAYIVGRAAHSLILEGRQTFDAEFAVGGPVNPRTGQPFGSTSKAFLDWKEQCGKTVLTRAQFRLVENMANSVKSHAEVNRLLSDGIAEGVFRTSYCDVPSQIRIDWLRNDSIVDLKTTDDIAWFQADAKRYAYGHQMAFYQAVYEKAVGETLPVYLVAVEKREPFRTGLWRVDENVLAICRQENEAAIERLKLCQANDCWPSGYEVTRVFDSV